MSDKNVDGRGRYRSLTVGFRISPEEREMLRRKVLLSGLSQQDYILDCILNKEITVYGNPYVYHSLHDELIHFIELYGSPIDPDDEEMMVWVLEMILALKSKGQKTVKTNKGSTQLRGNHFPKK